MPNPPKKHLLHWLLVGVLIPACHISRDLPDTIGSTPNKASIKACEGLYPFNTATSVRLIAFEPTANLDRPIINDTLDKTRIIQQVTLQAADIKRLVAILCQTTCTQDVKEGCYNPRHVLVCLNDAGQVTSYIEICLECHQYKTSIKEIAMDNFCIEQYSLLEAYFKSVGISYFKKGNHRPIPIEDPISK